MLPKKRVKIHKNRQIAEQRNIHPRNAHQKQTYTPENAYQKQTYTPEKQVIKGGNKKPKWPSWSFYALLGTGKIRDSLAVAMGRRESHIDLPFFKSSALSSK